MTIVTVRICFLCYQKGEIKEAGGYYTPNGMDSYDVCENCVELVKKQYDVTPLKPEDVFQVSKPLG